MRMNNTNDSVNLLNCPYRTSIANFQNKYRQINQAYVMDEGLDKQWFSTLEIWIDVLETIASHKDMLADRFLTQLKDRVEEMRLFFEALTLFMGTDEDFKAIFEQLMQAYQDLIFFAQTFQQHKRQYWAHELVTLMQFKHFNWLDSINKAWQLQQEKPLLMQIELNDKDVKL